MWLLASSGKCNTMNWSKSHAIGAICAPLIVLGLLNFLKFIFLNSLPPSSLFSNPFWYPSPPLFSEFVKTRHLESKFQFVEHCGFRHTSWYPETRSFRARHDLIGSAGLDLAAAAGNCEQSISKKNVLASQVNSPHSDSWTSYPGWMPAPFKRVVFLLVDALRFDWLAFDPELSEWDISREIETAGFPSIRFRSENSSDFLATAQGGYNGFPSVDFLLSHSETKDNTRLFKSIVEVPTVTTQKLRTLMSGFLPAFFEMAQSFSFSQESQDSLLKLLSANRQNKPNLLHSHVSMMGDDTWLGLYKESIDTAFGFPSFDVRDVDDVDEGVSQHLWKMLHFSELESKTKDHFMSEMLVPGDEKSRITGSWTWLVAHTLGSDHVGHLYGTMCEDLHLKFMAYDRILSNIVAFITNRDFGSTEFLDEVSAIASSIIDLHNMSEDLGEMSRESYTSANFQCTFVRDIPFLANTVCLSSNWLSKLLGAAKFSPLYDILRRRASKRSIGRGSLKLSAEANPQAWRTDTLFLTFGDHGMTDSGTHGESTTEEVEAGLMVFSPVKFLADFDSERLTANPHAVSRGGYVSRPDRPNDIPADFRSSHNYPFEVVSQVDETSTLGYLLGIPVPGPNIGAPIPSLFPLFDERWYIQQPSSDRFFTREVLTCSDAKTVSHSTTEHLKNLQSVAFDPRISEAIETISRAECSAPSVFLGSDGGAGVSSVAELRHLRYILQMNWITAWQVLARVKEMELQLGESLTTPELDHSWAEMVRSVQDLLVADVAVDRWMTADLDLRLSLVHRDQVADSDIFENWNDDWKILGSNLDRVVKASSATVSIIRQLRSVTFSLQQVARDRQGNTMDIPRSVIHGLVPMFAGVAGFVIITVSYPHSCPEMFPLRLAVLPGCILGAVTVFRAETAAVQIAEVVASLATLICLRNTVFGAGLVGLEEAENASNRSGSLRFWCNARNFMAEYFDLGFALCFVIAKASICLNLLNQAAMIRYLMIGLCLCHLTVHPLFNDFPETGSNHLYYGCWLIMLVLTGCEKYITPVENTHSPQPLPGTAYYLIAKTLPDSSILVVGVVSCTMVMSIIALLHIRRQLHRLYSKNCHVRKFQFRHREDKKIFGRCHADALKIRKIKSPPARFVPRRLPRRDFTHENMLSYSNHLLTIGIAVVLIQGFLGAVYFRLTTEDASRAENSAFFFFSRLWLPRIIFLLALLMSLAIVSVMFLSKRAESGNHANTRAGATYIANTAALTAGLVLYSTLTVIFGRQLILYWFLFGFKLCLLYNIATSRKYNVYEDVNRPARFPLTSLCLVSLLIPMITIYNMHRNVITFSALPFSAAYVGVDGFHPWISPVLTGLHVVAPVVIMPFAVSSILAGRPGCCQMTKFLSQSLAIQISIFVVANSLMLILQRHNVPAFREYGPKALIEIIICGVTTFTSCMVTSLVTGAV